MDDVAEKIVVCPYNKAHVVPNFRFTKHLLKCRKSYQGEELATCPFNMSHVIPKPEIFYHTQTCTDRHLVTNYMQKAPQMEKKIILDWDEDEEVQEEDNDDDDQDEEISFASKLKRRISESPEPSTSTEFKDSNGNGNVLKAKLKKIENLMEQETDKVGKSEWRSSNLCNNLYKNSQRNSDDPDSNGYMTRSNNNCRPTLRQSDNNDVHFSNVRHFNDDDFNRNRRESYSSCSDSQSISSQNWIINENRDPRLKMDDPRKEDCGDFNGSSLVKESQADEVKSDNNEDNQQTDKNSNSNFIDDTESAIARIYGESFTNQVEIVNSGSYRKRNISDFQRSRNKFNSNLNISKNYNLDQKYNSRARNIREGSSCSTVSIRSSQSHTSHRSFNQRQQVPHHSRSKTPVSNPRTPQNRSVTPHSHSGSSRDSSNSRSSTSRNSFDRGNSKGSDLSSESRHSGDKRFERHVRYYDKRESRRDSEFRRSRSRESMNSNSSREKFDANRDKFGGLRNSRRQRGDLNKFRGKNSSNNFDQSFGKDRKNSTRSLKKVDDNFETASINYQNSIPKSPKHILDWDEEEYKGSKDKISETIPQNLIESSKNLETITSKKALDWDEDEIDCLNNNIKIRRFDENDIFSASSVQSSPDVNYSDSNRNDKEGTDDWGINRQQHSIKNTFSMEETSGIPKSLLSFYDSSTVNQQKPEKSNIDWGDEESNQVNAKKLSSTPDESKGDWSDEQFTRTFISNRNKSTESNRDWSDNERDAKSTIRDVSLVNHVQIKNFNSMNSSWKLKPSKNSEYIMKIINKSSKADINGNFFTSVPINVSKTFKKLSFRPTDEEILAKFDRICENKNWMQKVAWHDKKYTDMRKGIYKEENVNQMSLMVFSNCKSKG